MDFYIIWKAVHVKERWDKRAITFVKFDIPPFRDSDSFEEIIIAGISNMRIC